MGTQRCKCGFRGGSLRACRCNPHDVDAYRSRISGPRLDRIDLHVEVPALAYDELVTAPLEEGTAPVRACVERARAAQRVRSASLHALHGSAQGGTDDR